ncbi:hypothetical protein [Mesorhizobium sp. WSM3873]|uniref:hypothetical protein n=1 Tax=Mesorhizobium sp. WSM3873 TaxID=1854056 RepID=UPI0007FC64EC|nr:hypothetical protein [Mesorhizobium sp. WSM3873]OBQ77392.1 hypothetical protein A9K71_10200 [Mesorhizobium sp. WSM3873]
MDTREDLFASVDLGNTVFSESKLIKTGTLRFLAGATIKVTNAAIVQIECERLIVDGALTIDVRGSNGIDGIPGGPDRPDWISGPPEDQDRAHWNWVLAVATKNPSEEGVPATPGTNGGDGGSFLVAYRRLGDGVSLGDVKILDEGGLPGAPAAGGRGQLMVCGRASDVATHVVRRPPGASWSGVPGRKGIVEFTRIASLVVTV